MLGENGPILDAIHRDPISGLAIGPEALPNDVSIVKQGPFEGQSTRTVCCPRRAFSPFSGVHRSRHTNYLLGKLGAVGSNRLRQKE
jgi:hypothetical protein